jgi:pyridoxine/pyridoxamine 5'-phosphate oxidase
MDRAAIRAFINRQRYGVVSSIATDGTPQSALVGIAATSRLEIIFDTVKSSRKYPNLIQRPACSLVIGWSGEQTLQLEGVAEEPCGNVLKQFQDVYFAEWPECRAHLSWPGIAYFVVHPHWLRYSDYDQRPPLIQEFTKEVLSSDF